MIKNKSQKLIALICAIICFSAFSASADNLERCLKNSSYQQVCQTLTQQSKCSRQITEQCCDCQLVWHKDFSYCQFTLALFPTPTPTAVSTPTSTPTPTPTPKDPIVPTVELPDPRILPPVTYNEGVRCEVRIDNSQNKCASPRAEIFVDGTSSRGIEGKPVNYNWIINCGDDTKALSAKLSNSATQKYGTTTLVLDEPALGHEARCNIALTVSMQKPIKGVKASSSCETVALINNCSLGCQSYDQRKVYTQADSGALSQSQYIGKMAVILQKLGVKKSTLTPLQNQAKQLYKESWTSIWNNKLLIKSCQNGEMCSASTYTANFNIVSKNSRTLIAIASKLLKATLKRTKNGNSARTKSKSLYSKIKKIDKVVATGISQFPLQVSECGGRE